MKKIIILVFAVLTLSFSAQLKIKAAVWDSSAEKIITVEENSVTISEQKTLTLNGNNWYIPAGTNEIFYISLTENISEESIERTKTSIITTDGSGNKLEYVIEEQTKDWLLISVRIPDRIDNGNSFIIKFNYSADFLLTNSAGLTALLVPKLTPDFLHESSIMKESLNTKVLLKKDIHSISSSDNTNVSISENETHKVIAIPQESLRSQNVVIYIGEKKNYSFRINQKYSKTTDLPIPVNSYELILPGDVRAGNIQQKAYFTSIPSELSSVRLDEFGNLVGKFLVPANKDGEFTIEGYLELSNVSETAPVSLPLFETYNSETKTWNTSELSNNSNFVNTAFYFALNSKADFKVITSEIYGEEYKLQNPEISIGDFNADKTSISQSDLLNQRSAKSGFIESLQTLPLSVMTTLEFCIAKMKEQVIIPILISAALIIILIITVFKIKRRKLRS